MDAELDKLMNQYNKPEESYTRLSILQEFGDEIVHQIAIESNTRARILAKILMLLRQEGIIIQPTVEGLKDVIKQLQENVDKLADVITQKNQEIQTLKENLQEALKENPLDDYQAKCLEVIQLQQENQKLKTEYEIACKHINQLSEQLITNQTELLQQKQNNSQLQNEINIFNRQLENNIKTIQHTIDEKSKIQSEIDQLQQEKQHQFDLQRLENEKKFIEDERKRLEEEKAAFKQEKLKHQNNLKNREKELKDKDQELNDKDQKLKDKEKEQKDKDQELNDKDQKLKDKEKELKDKEKEQKDKDQKLKDKEKEQKDKDQELKEKEKEQKEKDQELKKKKIKKKEKEQKDKEKEQKDKEKEQKDKEQELKDKDQELKDKEQKLKDKDQELKDKDQKQKDKDQELNDKEKKQKDKDQKQKDKDQKLKDKDQRLKDKEKELNDKEKEQKDKDQKLKDKDKELNDQQINTDDEKKQYKDQQTNTDSKSSSEIDSISSSSDDLTDNTNPGGFDILANNKQIDFIKIQNQNDPNKKEQQGQQTNTDEEKKQHKDQQTNTDEEKKQEKEPIPVSVSVWKNEEKKALIQLVNQKGQFKGEKDINTLTKIMNLLYNEKIVADNASDRETLCRHPFSSYIYLWLQQQYGIQSLIEQNGSEILNSVEKYKDENEEVALFFKFTSGQYRIGHLSFFLLARQLIQAVQQAYQKTNPDKKLDKNTIPTNIAVSIAALFFSFLQQDAWKSLFNAIIQSSNNDKLEENKQKDKIRIITPRIQTGSTSPPDQLTPSNSMNRLNRQNTSPSPARSHSNRYSQSPPMGLQSSGRNSYSSNQIISGIAPSDIAPNLNIRIGMLLKILLHKYDIMNNLFIDFVKKIFKEFDSDGDGTLNKSGFCSCLQRICPFLDPTVPKSIFNQIQPKLMEYQKKQNIEEVGNQKKELLITLQQVLEISEDYEFFQKNLCGTLFFTNIQDTAINMSIFVNSMLYPFQQNNKIKIKFRGNKVVIRDRDRNHLPPAHIPTHITSAPFYATFEAQQPQIGQESRINVSRSKSRSRSRSNSQSRNNQQRSSIDYKSNIPQQVLSADYLIPLLRSLTGYYPKQTEDPKYWMFGENGRAYLNQFKYDSDLELEDIHQGRRFQQRRRSINKNQQALMVFDKCEYSEDDESQSLESTHIISSNNQQYANIQQTYNEEDSLALLSTILVSKWSKLMKIFDKQQSLFDQLKPLIESKSKVDQRQELIGNNNSDEINQVSDRSQHSQTSLSLIPYDKNPFDDLKSAQENVDKLLQLSQNTQSDRWKSVLSALNGIRNWFVIYGEIQKQAEAALLSNSLTSHIRATLISTILTGIEREISEMKHLYKTRKKEIWKLLQVAQNDV